MIKRGLNKKGFFLAEETMKILLAVICLLFLVFVLGRMYYSYATDDELQQAKDTLTAIEKEVNSIVGDDSREIIIYSPKSWFLAGFSGQDMPDFCTEKKWSNGCLCICSSTIKPWITNMKGNCNNEGTCISFSGKTFTVNSIDLNTLPVTVLFSQSKEMISFLRK
jgi:hypothetical protein